MAIKLADLFKKPATGAKPAGNGLQVLRNVVGGIANIANNPIVATVASFIPGASAIVTGIGKVAGTVASKLPAIQPGSIAQAAGQTAAVKAAAATPAVKPAEVKAVLRAAPAAAKPSVAAVLKGRRKDARDFFSLAAYKAAA